MSRIGQLVLVTAGLVLAGTAWAGDTEALVRPVVLQPDSDVWGRTRPVFKFRDTSVLDRISKLRNVSFLTLARTDRTRLFLGVNKDGVVGLHFNARARLRDDHVLELASLQSKD